MNLIPLFNLLGAVFGKKGAGLIVTGGLGVLKRGKARREAAIQRTIRLLEEAGVKVIR